MKVLQYPLTQLTLFFVFGILFNRYLNLTFNTGLSFLVGVFLIFLAAFFVNLKAKNKNRLSFFTSSTLVLSFVIGNFTALVHQDLNDETHYFHTASDQAVDMKVILLERWKPTANNERFLAEVYTVNNHLSSGKILLNFRKDKTTKSMSVGSKMAIHARIILHTKPLNPDQFDYGSFLKNKSIYGQAYVDDTSIAVLNSMNKNLYYYSAIFRNRVINNLKNSEFNPKELAVVNALILGQRQDLDPAVLQNYQYAGAIHILSVSGLHVGFVLLFLNFFLNFLPNTTRFRVFKVVVVILILWSFALVAGFSPSVVRSVTMFSFVAVGMHMKRKTYVFYTFYCSILLILLFEPSFLFDVGFQLSYMALFFILWLQPEFAKIWKPKYKVMNYFWQIFTVTFAAQLGTMPLSLYYFHQFPGLFFVTNLLIMLLLTVIMGVGLLFVLIAFLTKLPVFIADILEKLIWVLNFIVEKIASVEYFIFKDISFNFWMMAALYASVFALGWFLISRNFRTVSFLVISVLFFQMSCFSFEFLSQNKHEWIVFQSKKNSVILNREGQNITVYSDKNKRGEIKNDRNIQSYKIANGCTLDDILPLSNFMSFNGKKILILDSTSVFLPEIKPSILVITQSPKINFERVLKEYKPEIVIVDASNYTNVVDRVRVTCNQQKIPFHAVAEKGFYRIKE